MMIFLYTNFFFFFFKFELELSWFKLLKKYSSAWLESEYDVSFYV